SGAPPASPASGMLGFDVEPAVAPMPALPLGSGESFDFSWHPKISPNTKSDKLDVLLCFMIKRSPFPQRGSR
ncbi:MAG TPA: hypothetical protein VHM25_05175, partial [Polyangiaceae bacterium]|nr:hypothetical protein [Polyangiaceae bacterium]